jgi:hypothetical protein
MEAFMEKEKEQEVRKLVNVLRRTARMAAQASWGWACSGEAQEPTAQYCAQQYNRIFERLRELDPTVETIFAPLDENARLEVVAMACRQLAAYYEEEIEGGEGEERRRRRHRDWGSFYETVYEAGPFKIFLGHAFKDMEELGKVIRECMPPWMRGEEGPPKSEEPKPSPGGESETKATPSA